MREFVSNLPDGLYTQVTGTESFSAGYRQLICFARVVLRDSKVIIMDEVLIDKTTIIIVLKANSARLLPRSIRRPTLSSNPSCTLTSRTKRSWVRLSSFTDIPDEISCCVLTNSVRTAITHRLNALGSFNKVLVLGSTPAGSGQILEVGDPSKLSKDITSHLSSFIDATGPTEAAVLRAQIEALSNPNAVPRTNPMVTARKEPDQESSEVSPTVSLKLNPSASKSREELSSVDSQASQSFADSRSASDADETTSIISEHYDDI